VPDFYTRNNIKIASPKTMDVLYYSNNCKHCQKLLAHLAKIGVLEKYNFICIDRRSVDPNTRQVSITLDRGVKASLPPNVSRVPTLLLVNQKFTAIIGDEIYNYVNANVKKDQDPNNLAVENGGEPIGYILSPSSGGVNIISETYTMYNAPPEELSAKGTGGTRQMHNYVSVSRDPASIQTPQDQSSKNQLDVGVEQGPTQMQTQTQVNRGMFPESNANSSLPTNATTYNAYSVPGVMYNTGQMIVPELQRPPVQRHVKLGEDVTVDSLQQQRNTELNNSLPFIAKQLNHIISPEISNIQPPERYNTVANAGGQGQYRGNMTEDSNDYYNSAAQQNAQQMVAQYNSNYQPPRQKLNPRDSQNILYGRQPPQNEVCYL
jgi:hypothetical protein